MSEWELENPYEADKNSYENVAMWDVWVAYAEGVRDGQRKLVEWLEKENSMVEDGEIGDTTYGYDPMEIGSLILASKDWQALRKGVL